MDDHPARALPGAAAGGGLQPAGLLELDGSAGEGGGQRLRSALTLSMCTGRPFRTHLTRRKGHFGGSDVGAFGRTAADGLGRGDTRDVLAEQAGPLAARPDVAHAERPAGAHRQGQGRAQALSPALAGAAVEFEEACR